MEESSAKALPLDVDINTEIVQGGAWSNDFQLGKQLFQRYSVSSVYEDLPGNIAIEETGA